MYSEQKSNSSLALFAFEFTFIVQQSLVLYCGSSTALAFLVVIMHALGLVPARFYLENIELVFVKALDGVVSYPWLLD